MKRMRGVLQRLPSLLDGGAFDAVGHEIRRVVPIDQLGIARVSDDGSHLRMHIAWTSPAVAVPSFQWGERVDTPRARLEQIHAGGASRLCRDTRKSIDPLERACAAAGISCMLSVPIGKPLAAVVGFGFATAEQVQRAHLPLLRRVARLLLERLDHSLLAAHAARLRRVTQSMPMGAILLGRDGRVDEVNPAAERMLGRTARDVVGRSIRELVAAPDGGALGWRIDRASGPAPGLVLCPDGARAVELQLAAPTGVTGGDAPQLYGPLFLSDASVEPATAVALARRNDELRALEQRHRAVIDDLPVVLFSTDARGRCSYISAAVERLLGYTPDEIYAMESFTALNIDEQPPYDYGALPGLVERDFRQRHKDGREIVMRYSVRVSAGADGRITGVQGFGLDVTVERDAQHQLLLADRLAALGMLVAGIGHEINNPAAYVSLGVQQIARHLRAAQLGPGDEARLLIERVLPILDDVSAGVHRIAEIVGELKLFSRDPSADEGAIDLNGVVRSSAALVQAELRSRARLVLELDELPPVPGSWARLSQVVLNLLINAAQAIAPGAPESNQVSLSTRRAGREVCIVVRDTGCGIAAGDRQRIFDPFFTKKPPGEGTGLGLAISYDIVRRLGGAIALDSEPGRGSTFTVTLPYAAPLAVTAGAAPAALDTSGSVLVVDDERPLAAAIARELSARMLVKLVHCGGDALSALARDQFDAVLCDLRMPDLSGAEVYRVTRARDRRQAARFVFMTGAGAAAPEAEFLRTCRRPVLEKPFAMAELWHTVGAVIGGEPV